MEPFTLDRGRRIDGRRGGGTHGGRLGRVTVARAAEPGPAVERGRAGGDPGFIGRRCEPSHARQALQDGGGLAGRGASGLCGRLGPDGLRPGHDRASGDGLGRARRGLS
jgi:hypothetical protein